MKTRDQARRNPVTSQSHGAEKPCPASHARDSGSQRLRGAGRLNTPAQVDRLLDHTLESLLSLQDTRDRTQVGLLSYPATGDGHCGLSRAGTVFCPNYLELVGKQAFWCHLLRPLRPLKWLAEEQTGPCWEGVLLPALESCATKMGD